MSIDVFALPVFPAADVFPMMAEDDLRELAEDIKANGVREPLVTAYVPRLGGGLPELMLVDGRNRRAACKIAGVEPPMRGLTADQDPTAFVISANIHRRHMTKGQRAMAVAFIYPEPEKGGRGKNSLKIKEFVSGGYISQARAILAQSRTLAAAVLAGSKSLNDAYIETRIATGKLNNESIRLRELRASRPDLADAVDAEEMTLDQAVAKAEADAKERKSQRWAFTRNLIEGVRGLELDIEQAQQLAAHYDPSCADGFGEKITPDRLRRAAAFANALADQLENSDENAA